MKAQSETAGQALYRSTMEGSEELRQLNDQIDRITFGIGRDASPERSPRRLKFDRILVGSRGLGGLRRLAAGSASAAVVHRASDSSVLLVKDPA